MHPLRNIECIIMNNLIIEKIVLGGMGLAHMPDGMVVLIPFVLPGEEVRGKVIRRHKGYAEVEVLEIVHPSPHRVVPSCSCFEQCGGCKLMHADYAFQCHLKDNCLRELFDRDFKGDKAPHFVFDDFLSSPRPLNYRQRIRLQVDERGRLGFFQAKTHQQVNISVCFLAESALNNVLAALNSSSEMIKWSRALSAVELLFSPHDEQVVVIAHLTRKARPADRKIAEAIALGEGLIKAVWLAADGAAMDGPYVGQVGGAQAENIGVNFELHVGEGQALSMGLEVGGFCQVNLSQNDAMVKLMLDWGSVTADERVLDLYCGLGNLSLPMARCAKEVVGIDLQRSTIRSAEKNAHRNKIYNCRFMQSNVGKALRMIVDEEFFDVIILDPPRQGCKAIISYLPKLGAKRLIYISCDPATLVRDLNSLADLGYKLVKICGLDMFPQTSHMETIALLVR